MEQSPPRSVLEELTNELTGMEIRNVNSGVLQQFYLSAPFALSLETCSEAARSYSFLHFSPGNHISQRFDEVERQQLAARPHHQHDFVEFMFVLEGTVTNRIEDQIFSYTQGQCCVMNKNIRHVEQFEGEFQVVFFMVQDRYLLDILNAHQQEQELRKKRRIPKESVILQMLLDSTLQERNMDKVYLDCLPVVPPEQVVARMLPLFNALAAELIEKRPGFTYFLKGIFARILQTLGDPALYSVDMVASQMDRQDYLFTKITHIMEAGHGRCTREQLSEQLHYSGEYLNRIVKKYTGKTISEYGQGIFLERSRRLLLDTDINISDLVQLLGFSNRTHFYRLFREAYGETPLEFRKNHKGKSPSD